MLNEGLAGDKLEAGPPPLPVASAVATVSGLWSLSLDLGLVLDRNRVVRWEKREEEWCGCINREGEVREYRQVAEGNGAPVIGVWLGIILVVVVSIFVP